MKFLQKYYFVFSGFIAFIIYTFTLAPSVVQIDSGELAAVQSTLGIAHPTGYPLFTIIGYLFSLIPLPFTKIFQLNLLAAVYCVLAASLFTYSSKIILDNIELFQFIKKEKAKKKSKARSSDKTKLIVENKIALTDNVKIIVSILAGFILAFSKTFWFQSTSIEVYSLHLLLIVVILLFLLKAYLNKDNSINLRMWFIFSIVLALGFTNHMTTILVLPGVAYLYFDKNKFSSKSLKQLSGMIVLFFLVLILIYAYLPIRASQNPLLNWGNPVDMERILRHISGKQYQVWLFSSTEAASKQLKYFLNNLPSEFSVTLILSAIGLIASFIRARKFFLFNLILFLSTVAYSINYDINDIDAYFLLVYIALSFFAIFGIVWAILFFVSKKISQKFSLTFISLLVVIQASLNYQNVNQTNNFTYEDYTKTLLRTLPQNSIVFSYQWDFFISQSYYFQLVENYRNDVTIVDKELLRRSWYYNQLERNHKNLLNGINPEVNQFLKALEPFERGEVFNSNLLENLFRRIMTGLVSTNISEHDYFIGPEVVDGEMTRGEFILPDGYVLVPHLLLFKVVNTDQYIEAPLPDFKIRFLDNKDKYAESLQNIIGGMLIRRAIYEMNFGFNERAKIYVKKAATDFSMTNLPPALQNLIND